ncbi:MAG TPA: CoA-binding protein [Bacteroidales bacterium]|nr:CoA-binding protein [Bacteroidales bacterium]
MNKKESIEQFLDPKKIAVAGVSANTRKFGYAVFSELRQKGFEICPINPARSAIEDVKCYQSVLDIPDEYKKLFIVTPKSETDIILQQAAQKGIKHVWIQQMSGTENSRNIAAEKGIQLIDKSCILMYAQPVKSIHKFHRGLWKFFGLLNK